LKDLEESHIAHQSCFIISDSAKAIAIKKIGKQMEARYISQQAIGFFYKILYYLVLNADKIVVPEELLTPKEEAKEDKKRPKSVKEDSANTKKKTKPA
jgi:phosphoenolpyruvate synthase/pyruvate phosphate dikinase